MTPIDLRSDTITRPTPAMRQAMVAAEVGDDVFEDDPTVQVLEQRVATMLGHEAALFMPSGTMSNTTAIRVHARHGDEVVVESRSHIFVNEVGGAAAICGVMLHTLTGEAGLLSAAQIRDAIRMPDIHHPRTALIAVENTHNYGGGSIHPIESLEEIAGLAREARIPLHLDGARLWNASAETGIALDRYGRLFDSISVCFSKGLGAPVGSALVGSRAFIAQARRVRKMLGGGMRQVGMLAAAALHALDHHLPRLREDHENARVFADRATRIPGVRLAQPRVETNIVFLDMQGTGLPAADVEAGLEAAGVRVLALDATRIRAVTHLQVTRDEVGRAADLLGEVVGAGARTR